MTVASEGLKAMSEEAEGMCAISLSLSHQPSKGLSTTLHAQLHNIPKQATECIRIDAEAQPPLQT